MYLIIDGANNNKPELVETLEGLDFDDADLEIITIINLIGTPKSTLLKYIKGGSWEAVSIRT